ncbi:LytR/AlgR family response regulator transcription factor [Hyphobacterium sp.]|uniref:LytR/AlgR family response regulator transcription factor n=1 Tax=Hyphobacterium sp. TaxID=2004662 RepID=UPI003B517B88
MAGQGWAATLLRVAALAFAVFGAIMAYLIFLYAPLAGMSAGAAVAAQQVTQWLWDAAFFVIALLAGRLYGQRRWPGPDRIAVKSPDRVDFVPVSSLLAVTGQGNYAALISETREVLHRATLAEMETLLSPHGFCRIHRSHLVRPSEIVSVRLKAGKVREVALPGGHSFPVSERHADHLGAHLSDPPVTG